MGDIVFDHNDIDKLVKEDKEDKIIKAKQLLESNGYIVRKWTKAMDKDADECVEMDERGEQKDCCECSCSVCLIQ